MLYAGKSRTRSRVSRPRIHGFSLLDLMMAIGAAALLAAIAVPSLTSFLDKGKVADARADIQRLEAVIERFHSQFGRLPPNLNDFDVDDRTDPWDQPYVYLNIEDGGPGIKGQVRKDKKLNPINTDYDLYSKGKDGDSKPALTPPPSHDDIVRGSNGGFVGLATDY